MFASCSESKFLWKHLARQEVKFKLLEGRYHAHKEDITFLEAQLLDLLRRPDSLLFMNVFLEDSFTACVGEICAFKSKIVLLKFQPSMLSL